MEFLTKRNRPKEAETVKLLKLPTPVQYRSWRLATRSEVCAASGRPDECFPWIQATENAKAKLEDFADPGTFKSLDVKLATAISKISSGPLGRIITLETEKAAKAGRLLCGRQALFLIHQFHK